MTWRGREKRIFTPSAAFLSVKYIIYQPQNKNALDAKFGKNNFKNPKKMNKQNKDKICGNCKHFCNQKGRTRYTRGAGYCQINFDAWEKEKNQLKDDEEATKTIPQIFDYFKCSNNKFQEK